MSQFRFMSDIFLPRTQSAFRRFLALYPTGKPDIYRLRKVMPGNSVDRVQLNNRVKGKRSDRKYFCRDCMGFLNAMIIRSIEIIVIYSSRS